MTTISITLHDDQVALLRSRAQRAGLTPEEFVRREVDGALKRPDPELVREVDDILRDNAELYRRLA